MLKYQKNCK